jgi:hypothetical protein
LDYIVSEVGSAAPITGCASAWDLGENEGYPGTTTSEPISTALAEADLPDIIISGRPLREYADEALQALELANNPPELFKQSGRIVSVVHDDNGQPAIQTVDSSTMSLKLSRVANFYRQSAHTTVHVAPSPLLVNSLLSRRDGQFPVLLGITQAPVLRPDGTILREAGYDATTRLVYEPDPALDLSAVVLYPDAAQLKKALATLDDILTDFPFEDGASRANSLAFLLTPVVRPAIDGCVPMAVLNGTNPGTGKGLLTSVVSMIATGTAAAVEAAPQTEEEWRKKITTALRAGRTFIVWDNLRGVLRATSLEAALTATSWSDRLLATNDSCLLFPRATWVATGNNVSLGPDMARRCYPIRLISPDARPWQRRGFRHPALLPWVTEHRAELLGALLTLARGWFSVGCPDPHVPYLGSFEQWTRVIGGILEHAGVTGFLSNLERTYAQPDDDQDEWEHFLDALSKHFPGGTFTVAQLVTVIRDSHKSSGGNVRNALPASLRDDLDNHLEHRMGKALARRLQTRFGSAGLYVEQAGNNSHTKAVVWRVRSSTNAQPVALQSTTIV